MEQTDEELMLKFQSGQKEAVAVIYERYKMRIFNFCLRMVGNRSEAEDAAGDVFLSLFDKNYRFHPEAKFSTWAFTIARNQCISRLRRQKNTVDADDLPSIEENSAELLAKKELAWQVKRAIVKLPREQKEAIVLREYHGLSYDEMAQVLECSLEKVKILIYRARENLRQELQSLIKE